MASHNLLYVQQSRRFLARNSVKLVSLWPKHPAAKAPREDSSSVLLTKIWNKIRQQTLWGIVFFLYAKSLFDYQYFVTIFLKFSFCTMLNSSPRPRSDCCCRRRLTAGKFMPCHASYFHTHMCMDTIVNSIAIRQRLRDHTICVSLSVLSHVLQFFSQLCLFLP